MRASGLLPRATGSENVWRSVEKREQHPLSFSAPATAARKYGDRWARRLDGLMLSPASSVPQPFSRWHPGAAKASSGFGNFPDRQMDGLPPPPPTAIRGP